MSITDEPNLSANPEGDREHKKPSLEEQLLTSTEMPPDLRALLSPELTQFADKIFDLRIKMAEAGKKPNRTYYFTRELTHILQSEYVQQDHMLKDFYTNLYWIEAYTSQIANNKDNWSKQEELYGHLFSSWNLLTDSIKNHEIPQDSLEKYDVHLLTVGTFNNFGGGVWGNDARTNQFNVKKIPPRIDIVNLLINAHQPQYKFKGDESSEVELMFSPGREPEFVDQFQSKDKISDIFAQTTHGDVLHIAPSDKSPQFIKMAQLFARLGANNVQIHGMVEEIIETNGDKRVRLMSPYFALLCDIAGIERDYITDEDRTFGIEDINVIHRDTASEFTSRETKGKFRKGQTVQFKALDPDDKVRNILMKVEGYFSGWLQGTLVDDDPRLSGFRTARPITDVHVLEDDK